MRASGGTGHHIGGRSAQNRAGAVKARLRRLGGAGGEGLTQQLTLPRTTVGNKYARMSDITRSEIDAKIDASEARTDTKFARLEGRFDLMMAKLDDVARQLVDVRQDNKATRSTVVISVVSTGVALFLGLAAIIIGLAVGLPAVYGIGTSTRDIIQTEVQRALPLPPAQ